MTGLAALVLGSGASGCGKTADEPKHGSDSVTLGVPVAEAYHPQIIPYIPVPHFPASWMVEETPVDLTASYNIPFVEIHGRRSGVVTKTTSTGYTIISDSGCDCWRWLNDQTSAAKLDSIWRERGMAGIGKSGYVISLDDFDGNF